MLKSNSKLFPRFLIGKSGQKSLSNPVSNQECPSTQNFHRNNTNFQSPKNNDMEDGFEAKHQEINTIKLSVEENQTLNQNSVPNPQQEAKISKEAEKVAIKLNRTN